MTYKVILCLGPVQKQAMVWTLDAGAKASREDRCVAGAAKLGQAGRRQAAGRKLIFDMPFTSQRGQKLTQLSEPK